MRSVFHPPKLDRLPVACAGMAVLVSFVLFVLVPATQLLSDLGGDQRPTEFREVPIPPPEAPPPEPPPPPEQKEQEDSPELTNEAPPLDLSQLEVALNPGTGDALAGGFSIASFGVTPDTVAEMDIFDVADLDSPPRRLSGPSPQIPFNLKREGIAGRVMLVVLIEGDGSVGEVEVAEAPHPDLGRAARDAVLRWRFSPPTRAGQPVRARYRLPISFTLGR